MRMGNISERVQSDSSKMEQSSDGFINNNSSFGASKFTSTESPKSPFSFPTVTSSPPPPPVGLSLILLDQQTNPYEQVATSTVFSSRPTLINFPILQAREFNTVPPQIQVTHDPMEIFADHQHFNIFSDEEYTCVRSYGPNPKVTHIYGDYILSTTSTVQAAAVPAPAPEPNDFCFTDGFLNNCFVCKKNLLWKDIYFYGDMSFCSEECRLEEMGVDDNQKID